MEKSENPPTIIGTSQPGSSLRELEAHAADKGCLEGLRIDTGYYYDNKLPREERGRDR